MDTRLPAGSSCQPRDRQAPASFMHARASSTLTQCLHFTRASSAKSRHDGILAGNIGQLRQMYMVMRHCTVCGEGELPHLDCKPRIAVR